MTFIRYRMVIFALMILSACSSGAPDPTLVAENAALSTQIVDFRTTATYAADRLERTAEYVNTALADVERRYDELAATLQEAGIDPTLIAQVSPNPAFERVVSPTPPVAQALQTPQPAASVLTTPETSPGETATPLLTPTFGQAALYNVVTALEVGDDDCALQPEGNFRSSAEKIYVVATAAGITAGTTLGSLWYQGETQVTAHDFTPDFDINSACIWFFVDQTDFVFAPGNYSVQLTINGTPTGPRLQFVVTS